MKHSMNEKAIVALSIIQFLATSAAGICFAVLLIYIANHPTEVLRLLGEGAKAIADGFGGVQP